MPRRHDRRAYIDRPFLDDHLASERDRRAEPRGFGGYLRWFLEGFWAETPERVHVAGVWFGRPARVDAKTGEPVERIPVELVGGSQLGAPRQAEPFRQLIENSPRQVAGDATDEHYVRPVRAALERLHSRTDGDGPLPVPGRRRPGRLAVGRRPLVRDGAVGRTSVRREGARPAVPLLWDRAAGPIPP